MLMTLIEQAKRKQVISELDIHLTQVMMQTVHCKEKTVFILLLWLSIQTRHGHVCVQPELLSDGTLFQGRELLLAKEIIYYLDRPLLLQWKRVLMTYQLANNGRQCSPLVIYNEKLYFQRMWQAENQVACFFHQKSLAEVNSKKSVEIRVILAQLFDHDHQLDQQKVAVALALSSQLTIISGGPGTGKTTTVAKILAGLFKLQTHRVKPALRIVLAAPTGKAAARLTESLRQAISALSLSPVQCQLIPQETKTLHRLLGAKADSRFFHHHAMNPLHLDLLIIDEASMIDLSLMASVIEALPKQARLILLGDHDQLSSVEAGAVLGDLYRFSQQGYSQKKAKLLSELTQYPIVGESPYSGLNDAICLLTKRYRFDPMSGIGQLATAINNGNIKLLKQLWQEPTSDLQFLPLYSVTDYKTALELCIEHYHYFLLQLQNLKADCLLKLLGEFQLLCVLRQGKFGVSQLNKAIEQALIQSGLITKSAQQEWYIGRPIMIRRNHHQIGLYNGDTGITLYCESSHCLKVFFRLPDGQIKGFMPNRLPENETAFAITVHQSQGSEFDKVLFIMPVHDVPILTRELVYTAVTRAKKQLMICCNEVTLFESINKLTHRQSGLVEQLEQLAKE